MTDIQRITLDEVVLHFAELEDPRSTVNRRHPLVSVVVIAVLAVLSGASGPTAIAEWAAAKEEFLIEALDLPNGVPRKDVFRRVLMALKPATFQACYVNWLNSLRAKAAAASGVERPVLAIDGKTARRSHDRKNGLGALHSVSVWASEFGLSLGQVACAEKSNEITAIPEVLRLVDIKGAIITIDAMGTQKAIAADIIDGGGDYVLASEGEPGDAPSGGHRSHRRTARGRAEGCPGAGDDREGSRSSRDADLPPAAGARDPAGVHAMEGPEDDRDRDVAVPPRRQGDDRGSLLHQQPGHGGEATGACGAGPLGHREYLPLGARRDVSRGRVADPGGVVAGEYGLAESLHSVSAEATSRSQEHRDETPPLWLG